MTVFSPKTGRILLLFLICVYSLWWFVGNRAMLVNPYLQTDDVRIHIFAFHRYTGNEAMARDPIATEMLDFMTPGVRAVYRLVVPLTGVPMATKVVQAVCLAILFLAVYLLAHSGGPFLASAALLLFFILHTPPFIAHIVGGLQRAFAIPCFVLWISGAFTASRSIRVTALILSALTYPVALALLLVAELCFTFGTTPWQYRTHDPRRREHFVSEGKKYAMMLLACILLLVPYQVMKRHAGPAYSLDQAQQESAFGPHGRIQALPFPDPLRYAVYYFTSPLRSSAHFLASRLSTAISKKQLDYLVAFGFLLLTVCGVWQKIIPVPRITLCLLVATVSMYILSRVFAFHFYWPRRYLEYGFPLVCITALAETLPHLRISTLPLVSSWTANALIIGVLVLGGDGIVPGLMISLDKREHYALYEFFSRLPTNTRVAAHPNDGDDIPFWSGRPTTGGYETLQPWFVDSWRRQKAFTEELLSALYATDWRTLLGFCQKYAVTHLLLRPERYGPDFRAKARLFEPFRSYVQTLLSSVELDDLVLLEAIRSRSVFRDHSFIVIEVDSLLRLAKQHDSVLSEPQHQYGTSEAGATGLIEPRLRDSLPIDP